MRRCLCKLGRVFTWSWTLWNLNLGLFRTGENKFLLFKLLSLWYFIMTAQSDYYKSLWGQWGRGDVYTFNTEQEANWGSIMSSDWDMLSLVDIHMKRLTTGNNRSEALVRVWLDICIWEPSAIGGSWSHGDGCTVAEESPAMEKKCLIQKRRTMNEWWLKSMREFWIKVINIIKCCHALGTCLSVWHGP